MAQRGTGTPLRRLRSGGMGLSFDTTGRVTGISFAEGAISPAAAVELAEKEHDPGAIRELLGLLANAMTMEHPVAVSALPPEVIAWGGRVLGNLRNGEEADEVLGLERQRGRRKTPATEAEWEARSRFESVQALRAQGDTYATAVERIAAAEGVSRQTIKRAWSKESKPTRSRQETASRSPSWSQKIENSCGLYAH